MSTEPLNQGLLEAALEISQKRRNTLVRARAAAENNDLTEVKRLLKELVPDEALHTTSPCEHVRTGGNRSGVLTFAAKRKHANG